MWDEHGPVRRKTTSAATEAAAVLRSHDDHDDQPPDAAPEGRVMLQHATRSRRSILLVALVAALVVVGSPHLAVGAPAQEEDPRQERAEARARKAGLASELDALRASDGEVEASLAAVQENVALTQARLASARQAVADAEKRASQAQEELDEAEAHVDELLQQIEAAAIDAYIDPTGERGTDPLLSEDLNDVPIRRSLLEARTVQVDDALDEYRAATEDLEIQRGEARTAAEEAKAEQGELEARLDELEEAERQQAELAAGVDRRIDAALAESASLEQLDAELSGQIRAEQEALAEKVRQARTPAPSGGGGDGGGPAPVLPGPPGGIVSVRGIQVASSIAGQLEGLLSAADAAGVSLSGGGYRDPAAQIAARKRNCGTSNYAIYHMPPSQCSPPTARPGESMHERGLAIDFTHNGSLIRSRSSPGFRWLAANAGRFGFSNLPSEPWHWSTNGQ
jgi:peptidoglycan hydrolase CwlO-like protein